MEYKRGPVFLFVLASTPDLGIFTTLLLSPCMFCFHYQERTNDYMEDEHYPNELEVIVVCGIKLRVMDTKNMLNRNPSSVIKAKKEQ